MGLVRIVLTGGECTGKSSLAQMAKERLGVPVSDEFAKEYALHHSSRLLTLDDALPIGVGQVSNLAHARKSALEIGCPWYLADTDLLSTEVYCQLLYGAKPEWLAALSLSEDESFYVLSSPKGIPWQDALERRDASDRWQTFDAFRSLLQERALAFEVLDQPSLEERWLAFHAMIRALNLDSHS